MEPRRRDTIAAELRATAADAGWTPWQLTQTVFDKAQTPTLLMAWRLAAGHTQAQVITGIQGLAADEDRPCAPSPSPSQLSNWENGRGRPDAYYRRYLALWFRTTLERLGLAEDEPIVTLVGEALPAPHDLEEDVDRRRFLSLAAATPLAVSLTDTRALMTADLRRQLPAADLEHWWDLTGTHAHAYGTTPPGALLARLDPDLAEIASLTKRYPHQRDLHLIASRLCGLTGALHTDLAQDRQAREWLYTASRYADLSGNTAQQYWVAMAEAMDAFYSRTPQRVIHIALRARHALGEDSPTPAAAQLAGLAARAHAQTGNVHAAHTELDKARVIFGNVASEQANEPWWGFPEREMTMYSSQVLSRTGHRDAWREQDKALAGYPTTDVMDRPLIFLDRARYLTGQNHPHEAAKVAADAITAIPARLRVPLLLSQVSDIADLIGTRSTTAASELQKTIFPHA
ncbi:helix-turn-helix domain-containing protein [Actinomadura hibisca]|uniref:helix-turn-helix domain-containing protein n=1 Tax=Actinomadura hibisca TaxID=68565 RepID=UPI0008367218|nr:helix-turn-helix transcriptional regulator [Actinomadura hibisca]